MCSTAVPSQSSASCSNEIGQVARGSSDRQWLVRVKIHIFRGILFFTRICRICHRTIFRANTVSAYRFLQFQKSREFGVSKESFL